MLSTSIRGVIKRSAISTTTRNSILSRAMSTIPSWATYDPKTAGSTTETYAVQNLCDGNWTKAKSTMEIIHPLDKDAHPIFTIPDTQADEIQPFVDSLRKVSKSGVHNPLKNPHRYLEYGEISRKVSRRNALGCVDDPSKWISTSFSLRFILSLSARLVMP